jgi:hypothetical protein
VSCLSASKVHPLAKSTTYNIRDIARIPIRLKIVTGNYILQSDKAAFSIYSQEGFYCWGFSVLKKQIGKFFFIY